MKQINWKLSCFCYRNFKFLPVSIRRKINEWNVIAYYSIPENMRMF